MAYTTINKSTDYFNTKLYTGNGSTNAITGVGFQPDWVWCKQRNATNSHQIYDAVRGATKSLSSDVNNAEQTLSTALTAFGTDGFTLGSASYINGNSNTYASWNWKANGQGSANTDGSISSTVSANQTAGFSIVKYTTPSSGTSTVGHGLGAVPKVWLHKRLNDSENWQMYHHSIGNTKKLMLNSTNAEGTSSIWQDTTPTSSLMYLGTAGSTVHASSDYVAYCFAEKTGYSKFGSYTGNGNADGTFVYTGFKPTFVMIKGTSSGVNWHMFDSKRSSSNVVNKEVYADSNSAEATATRMDFTSQGFKLRSSSGSENGSGSTYIYMAFGQSLVGSNNVPCTAR